MVVLDRTDYDQGLLKIISDTSKFRPIILTLINNSSRLGGLDTQCFISYSNTSNSVTNTPLLVVFSTFFSVLGYPDETLSLVFDILEEDPTLLTEGKLQRLVFKVKENGPALTVMFITVSLPKGHNQQKFMA